MTTLDDLGPFFAVRTHARGQRCDAPWLTMAALIEDPHMLEARVERVRAALGAGAAAPVEQRVAASVTHLGLVARLIAPMIAVAALDEPPISVAAEDLWWQDELGGPYPLSVTAAATDVRPNPADGVVGALTDAVGDGFGVSGRTLWGNVASATNSAARLIATARPEQGALAVAAADRVLAEPHVEDGRLRAGPRFRRRSCCLIYRVSGDRGAVCGDCVLI
ncbi:(2Fe-2S)-binding protein [Gordonia polyisoprenivorans]|uniref:(2Fe-2S)-binding protein n=1 Tax=Gordonia polyisoprenivorans TaxID=84595 RepID=UPI001AD7A336|nr:(2Fe-2S)-binding protein [Gordonia polyisoprenivorans]QTI71210.1 (2Fe-2S)-binding protein [Gordonia polyisoprenivorans]